MTESLVNPMLWQPSPQECQSSAMHRLAERLGRENDLYEWSVSQPEAFWSEVWDECGVVGAKGERAFVAAQLGAPMSTARFFPDASLSVVENFLQRIRDPSNRAIVIHEWNDEGEGFDDGK